MCTDHKKRPTFSVGILAGGKSTRMGQNKALMEFQNETMIGRISKQFLDCKEILVSASSRGLYEAEGLRVVYDEHESIGPVEGIRQVLVHAENEYVFVCAADMPFVNREIAEYLAEFISSDYDCYVITDGEKIHPLCAIYSKRVLPVIEELIAERRYRLLDILNRVRTKYVSLAYTCFEKKIVKNVNTRDEFLELTRPAVFCVSGFHDSGKTGLIEKLINEFIRAGYTVGCIKHDGRDHIDDAEGTDTWRYRKAGADCTAVFSDTRLVFEANEAADPEALIAQMKHLKNPPDVIILEGFKHSKYPKLEVVRKEICEESVADPETLILIASDCISPEKSKVPVYRPDDIRGIFSCIIKYVRG